MRDLLSTAILLGVLQCVVLAPVLWARRANRLANRILATLIGTVGLMLLLADLTNRSAFGGHPHLLALGQPLPFLFSPLFYLYAVALTRPVIRIDPRWLAHAVPFVADVLFMTQAFYLKGPEEKLAIARDTLAGNVQLSLQFVQGVEVVQALVYLFLTWRALERYGSKMEGYFSDLARIDLRWLRALVLGHFAIWSVVLLSFSLRWTGGARASVALGHLVEVGSSFVMFLTGYVSLWQPELVQKATAARVADNRTTIPPSERIREPAPILDLPPAPEDVPEVRQPADESIRTEPAPEPDSRAAAAPAPPLKYQRNRLDDEEAKELVTKLEALMAETQLYRDPGLTLPTLADELGVTPHTLSQVLNVRVGKSFFVYVNTYRSEALKEALADPARSERGVLELALEVGFSSKSTLNSSFKKHTGMTPTEFRGRVFGRQKNA